MFRLTSNTVRPKLVALVALCLSGLSGGLVYASCQDDECVMMQFEFHSDALGGYECTEYDSATAYLSRSTVSNGGTLHCGSGTRMRDRDACYNCLCEIHLNPQGLSTPCLAVSSENSTWYYYPLCSCIPNS